MQPGTSVPDKPRISITRPSGATTRGHESPGLRAENPHPSKTGLDGVPVRATVYGRSRVCPSGTTLPKTKPPFSVV